MQETTFEKERERSLLGHRFVVGIDEAGRGPLAGPVVAAAVCYRDPGFAIPESLVKGFALIRDSKKLSEKKREEVFETIQKYFYVGVGIVNAETIDRVNILQATFLAMKSAIASLKKQLTNNLLTGQAGNQQKFKDEDMFILVDGNQEIPNISLKQEAVVGGDGTVKSIAAASIIAKVTRDRLVLEYDTLYPGYGFAKHKGYGTKTHMDALRRLGPCPVHRMSFRPVLLALPENVNKRFANVLKPKRK